MNEQQEQLLNEYLDGTLNEAEQQAAETLLATSAEARAFFAELQQMFIALDELDELPLMTDLSAQVMTQIVAEPATSERWIRWILLAQIAVASLVIMQLWPTLQGWLLRSQDVIATQLNTFTWPELTIWQEIVAWVTAVLNQLTNATPTLNLASGQWSLLIILAFVAWLASNRFLVSNQNEV
ncbi:MAG: hypothetical protein GY943_29665 [Chloroflexi bacterium]|nr:hypothetical protein [Chloroflexota bacterium]